MYLLFLVKERKRIHVGNVEGKKARALAEASQDKGKKKRRRRKKKKKREALRYARKERNSSLDVGRIGGKTMHSWLLKRGKGEGSPHHFGGEEKSTDRIVKGGGSISPPTGGKKKEKRRITILQSPRTRAGKGKKRGARDLWKGDKKRENNVPDASCGRGGKPALLRLGVHTHEMVPNSRKVSTQRKAGVIPKKGGERFSLEKRKDWAWKGTGPRSEEEGGSDSIGSGGGVGGKKRGGGVGSHDYGEKQA